jgi:hypothetical protein
MSTPAYLIFPNVSSGSVGDWNVERPTIIRRRTKIEIVKNNDSKTIDRKRAALFSTFHSLVNRWRRETGHLSSPNDICTHPAYQAIIDLGNDAVPYILRDLEKNNSYWFWALTAITKADPIPHGFQGAYEDAVKIWLDYAKQHGYKW